MGWPLKTFSHNTLIYSVGIILDQLTKGNEVDYVYRHCVVGCLLYSRHSGRHVRKLMLRAALLRVSLGSEAARCGSLSRSSHSLCGSGKLDIFPQPPVHPSAGIWDNSEERSEPGMKA